MYCPKCGKDAGSNKLCPGCGTDIAAETSYKPTFRNTQNTINTSNTSNTSNASNTSSMAENTAALLSYILGWVTGIIFFIIDKRPFVRFHAAQSIVVFGAVSVINIVLGSIISFSPYPLWALFNIVNRLVELASLVIWILMLVKANQGKYYKLPIAGDIAERLAKNNGSL